AVLLWSTVASAFKLSLRYLDYAQLLLYSSIVATLFLGALLAVTRRLGRVFPCSWRECLKSAGLGFLNPFLYYAVLFKAYALLPAQVAQPLNYTWAIALALLSIPILKQRIGARDIVGGLVCYAGVLVISTRGNLFSFGVANPLGVSLALGSTVVWALYWIYNTKDGRDPAERLFLNFVFGLPFVLIYCLVFSDIRVANPLGFAGAAYVGMVEMGVAFVLWLSALRLSETTAKVGNLIFLSPFVSLLFIRVFVGEEIHTATVVGLVLVVAGIAFQGVGRRNPQISRQ
ncbi:MAG: DMT family transporter, partial [Candidatus Eisenbacteria sp.]|nr:DMT family transporter [Candidatus Eisenbacteria bacterium]